MAEDRIYIPYPFRTPRMDQSVPPNQVRPGSFGRLSGVLKNTRLEAELLGQ